MTLKVEADELGITQPTCFSMCHKLHDAVSKKKKINEPDWKYSIIFLIQMYQS